MVTVTARPPRALRVTITCEACGHRQELERKVVRLQAPRPLYIVCHRCELPITGTLPADPDGPEHDHQAMPYTLDSILG